MGLFGGGNTSSTTNQYTTLNETFAPTTVDAKQTTTTTTNNITTLDAGAIDASKSIALSGIANNATNTANLLAVADKLFTTQQKALDANVTLANSLASSSANAYADASSQAQGNKNLVYAGLAVVGIAAFSFFGKK